MQVMGTNRWTFDVDLQVLMARALEFSALMAERGIAELHGAWIAEEDKLMWCSWDTDDLDALQAAFAEMHRQSGLSSEPVPVKTFFSTIQDTVPV